MEPQSKDNAVSRDTFDHIGAYNFTSEKLPAADPLTGNELLNSLNGEDFEDFTKGESPWTVTLNFEEIKWTVVGSPTSQPETNGLVPHTIALSHPFSDDRVVTMYGSDSLDGLGY